MSLFHFNVTQVSRGKGQTAVASAAYRSGEKLHDSYYDEDPDCRKKGGVLYTEILLPEHVPKRLSDRETLWNEVESVEKHPQAQLAYSFNLALQNELTYEENLELARQFVLENFVAKGMIADLAILRLRQYIFNLQCQLMMMDLLTPHLEHSELLVVQKIM